MKDAGWIVRDGDRQGPVVCDLDVMLLAAGAPPQSFSRGKGARRPTSARVTPRDLLTQWDGTVGGDTWLEKESDAGLLRVRLEGAAEKRLAVALGAPRGDVLGAAVGFSTVVEACLRVAAIGARPLALSDGLNFGSPRTPAIMDELASAIAGLGDAARAFDVPIVSGNVSLSNQTHEQAIPPTPFVVCVGLLAPDALPARSRFERAGVPVWLVGAPDETRLAALVTFSIALGEARIERLVHAVPGQDIARGVLEMSTRLDALDDDHGADWRAPARVGIASLLVATVQEDVLVDRASAAGLVAERLGITR